MNLTGTWLGEYTYGLGYPTELIGLSAPFQLDLVDKEGIITGTCMDEVVEAKDENESYINGYIEDNQIYFKKRYKFHLGIDESGNLSDYNDPHSDGVDYKGILHKKPFSDKIYFSGEWSITSKYIDENGFEQLFVCEGTWTMKREE